MNDRSDDALPEWTEEELALLRSAEHDRPPQRSLPATLAALGIGSTIVSSTAGAAAATWGGIAAVSKTVAVVALGAVVVGGGVAYLTRSEPAKPPVVEAAQRLPAAPKAVPRPQLAPLSPAPPPAVKPAPASSPASKRPAPSQPDIRLEIAALDAARTTLRSGRPAQALVALDRYDARFAKTGALGVEATALRIEALVRAGDRTRAAALAAAFTASHPRSPYAARIRALLSPAPGASSRP